MMMSRKGMVSVIKSESPRYFTGKCIQYTDIIAR
jgi:hypothetical protein